MAKNNKNQNKTTDKNNNETSKETNNSNVSNNNSNIIMIVISLVQIVLLLIIIILLISGNSTQSNPEGNSQDMSEKIDSMNKKVNAIDNFFRQNVDGYDSEGSLGNNGGSNTENTEPVEISIENEPMLGEPNAPITIVEFSDYECPFCKRFYDEAYQQIKQEYIDTGKAKLVFKDFALSFHQMAKPAAAAANCVFEQLGDEKYFEMHDKIFENQNSLSEANLKTWALELGVDETQYDSCIVDPEILSEIDEDLAEGSANGVSGTPSFFIDGELLVGAQPFSAFKNIIDAKLAE